MKPKRRVPHNTFTVSLLSGKPLLALLALLLLTTMLTSVPANAQQPTGTDKAATIVDEDQPLPALGLGATAIPNQYIVVFKDDAFPLGVNSAGETTRQAAKRMAAQTGATVRHFYSSGFKGFAAIMSPTAVRQLQANPAVAYIEPDQPVSVIPVAPDISILSTASWGLDRIDQRTLPLNNLYNSAVTGTGVHAYIIDTGIRATHQEFSGRMGAGYDFIDTDPDPADCNGHGTHVAGTVGGTTYGVAPDVTLHAVRVLDCGGSGTTSGVIAGIDWVIANHIKPAVINMSLGGSVSTAMNDAAARAHAAGITVVVAAGNSNADACSHSPASAPEAITVGSSTSLDARSSFSNFGTCVDIFAPGSSITSAWIGNDTASNTISGTSMASPHVAGAAALYLQTVPTDPPANVADNLTGHATPDTITDPGTGSPNKLLYTGDITGHGLLVSPANITACIPDAVTYTVKLATDSGVLQSVDLTDLPPGLNGTFNAAADALNVSISAQAVTGTFTLDFTAQNTATVVFTNTADLTLLPDPTEAVTLLQPADAATTVARQPFFTWSAATGDMSYNLEIATEASFDNIIYNATVQDTSHQLPIWLEPETEYYWRVQAVNLCGLSPVAIRSFTTRAIPATLLVDDDDNYPDVRDYYTAALDALGTDYEVFDTDSNDYRDPTAEFLAPYENVLWFTGADFWDTAGPNSLGQAALVNWFATSPQSCFFISSQDYLWAQGYDIDTPNIFMTIWLGAGEAVSDEESLTGTGAGIFDGYGPYTLDYPFDDYSDMLSPGAGASLALSGDDEMPMGISKMTSTYRTIWWASPFEAIPTAGERQAAMGRVLQWCGNNAPTDINLSNTTVPEHQPAGTLVGYLSALDADDSSHSFSLVPGAGDADNSSFSITDGALYTAAEFDYPTQSQYTIRVQATDDLGAFYAEQFTVQVGHANGAPTAINDSASIAIDTPITINVLTNDTDPDNDNLIVVAVGSASNGAVSLSNNKITYTPNSGFTGSDIFAYTISDGLGGISPAAVTIRVVSEPLAEMQVDPTTGGNETLPPTETAGATGIITPSLSVPGGAVPPDTQLNYAPLPEDPEQPAPSGYQFASFGFSLDAKVGGVVQSTFTFSKPVTLTLEYNGEAIAGFDENSLELRYWDELEKAWLPAGEATLDREHNRLIVVINHLTEFAIFSNADSKVYLPLIIR